MSGLIKTEAKLIYVAGPINNGGKVNKEAAVLQNVDRAIMVGTQILMLGHIPFIPHLSHFWENRMKQWVGAKEWQHMPIVLPDHSDWLDMDKAVINRCDALFRMTGVSKGADMEVEYCKERGIPYYTEWPTLVDYLYR